MEANIKTAHVPTIKWDENQGKAKIEVGGGGGKLTQRETKKETNRGECLRVREKKREIDRDKEIKKRTEHINTQKFIE